MIENTEKEEPQESVKITRYDLKFGEGSGIDTAIEPFEDGEYVKYEDYLAVKLNPNNFKLTKDDAAVYRMMQAILDITGDCEQNETFSGWQIQAVQNSETGEYIKLELIATDNLCGIIAPRC